MEREPSPGGPSCGGEGVCYALAKLSVVVDVVVVGSR